MQDMQMNKKISILRRGWRSEGFSQKFNESFVDQTANPPHKLGRASITTILQEDMQYDSCL